MGVGDRCGEDGPEVALEDGAFEGVVDLFVGVGLEEFVEQSDGLAVRRALGEELGAGGEEACEAFLVVDLAFLSGSRIEEAMAAIPGMLGIGVENGIAGRGGRWVGAGGDLPGAQAEENGGES